MTALSRRQLMSVTEYFQLCKEHPDTRYEYIDGYVTMLAGETLNHAAIGANMYSLLRNALRGRSCRAYTSDACIQLSKERYVYPDATVTCNERDQGQVDAILYPHLVVEVFSPSTEDYDRGRKFTYYRNCSTIQEYVLINAMQASIEVCRRERNDLWILQLFGPNDMVELVTLGIQFPVSAVYEGIVFSGPNDRNDPA
ncbi:Uma2 family endonuclease [Ktedonospora formicarum]|uniref:Putative restriction endonuclease domain-containing protein n=1 Tax=Ktedonospora formicarum TaxID=2778364 RepID=A0A8J3I2X5_9CHLR|nr:Uma2 family endonuclease [Ktedonospora formicarum]GHO45048.1 hypothetical protein KSX_32110 [Ktedonospora formicarum]